MEPLLWDGCLWLSMLWASRKAVDLRRDPRLLVHSIMTSRDGTLGEFKVRGRAVPEEAEAVQEAYATEVLRQLGSRPTPGRFHLFRVDLDDVTFIRYDDKTGDQFVARWPSRREFVRRGTSATTVGEPEPWHELLTP